MASTLRKASIVGVSVALMTLASLVPAGAQSYASSQASSQSGSEAGFEAEYVFSHPAVLPYGYYPGYMTPQGYFSDFNVDSFTNGLDYDNGAGYIDEYDVAPRRTNSQHRVMPRTRRSHTNSLIYAKPGQRNAKSKPVTLYDRNHRPMGVVY